MDKSRSSLLKKKFHVSHETKTKTIVTMTRDMFEGVKMRLSNLYQHILVYTK